MSVLMKAAVVLFFGVAIFGVPIGKTPLDPQMAEAYSNNPAAQTLEIQARGWVAQNYRAWTVVSSKTNDNLTAVWVEARFRSGVPNALFRFNVTNTGRQLVLQIPPVRTQ